jgi:hypothetical protein
MGKAITVMSENPGDPSTVDSTVINGENLGPCVSFVSGEGFASVLAGFTLTSGGIYFQKGGGVNWFMVGLIVLYLGGSVEAAVRRNWWQSAYNAAGALITLAAMMMGRQ